MSFQPQVRKSNRETLRCGDFVLLLTKYILILVQNFLDHFELNVLKESIKYVSIRTLVLIAHRCDH